MECLADPVRGQHDRCEPREHVRERNHATGGQLGLTLDRVEAERVGERQRAAARPPQRDQVAADAEPFTEVVRERSDVEAGGAVHSERHSVAVNTDDFDGVGGDADWVWQVGWVSRAGGAEARGHGSERRRVGWVESMVRDRAGARRLQASVTARPCARQLVAALPVDLLRRERRRLLQEFASKGIQCRVDRATRQTLDRALDAERPALGIAGVRREPEADDRFVRLVAAAQELCETRRPSHDQRQDACRGRVQRPGVADAPLAQGAAHSRHDVVRCRSGRFVND